MGIRSRLVASTPKTQTTKSKAVSVYVDDGTGVYRPNEDGAFPTTGYVLNTEKSGCANGGVLSQNPETKTISLSVSGSDQCHVYFDKEKANAIEQIIASSKGTITDFDSPASDVASAGVYELADEGDTISYYFRGPVENNYVRFGKWNDDEPEVYAGDHITFDGEKYFTTLSECEADQYFNKNCTLLNRAGKDMYWRIIRVNGDGSLRMIYAGTSAHVNSNQGPDTFIGISSFNLKSGDNKYVGYMYSPAGTTASTTKTQAQQNTVSSTIKSVLEKWYAKNLEENYGQYINKDAMFCNDRSINKGVSGWSQDTGLGYGNKPTAFGTFNRFVYIPSIVMEARTNIVPTFICPQENDKFTVAGATTGNKVLSKPIGLITADEIVAAGSGKYNTPSDYYLKRSSYYYSISPSDHNYVGASTRLFFVKNNGAFEAYGVNGGQVPVAPVVNLSAEYAKTLVGDGTVSSPYHA